MKIDEDVKSFINMLDFTGGKYSAVDIFKDLVTLETYFINATMLNNKDYANEFDNVMKKYTANEQINMWNLVIELPMLYSKQTAPIDIMGEIFNCLNMSNTKTGQYFTPEHISKFITVSMGINTKEIEEQGYTLLVEPSCRVGNNGIIICK